jgi:hypothetical protein
MVTARKWPDRCQRCVGGVWRRTVWGGRYTNDGPIVFSKWDGSQWSIVDTSVLPAASALAADNGGCKREALATTKDIPRLFRAIGSQVRRAFSGG